MPIRKKGDKWGWGRREFDSRKKAEEVARAAHASGYEGSIDKFHMQDASAIGQSTPNVTGKTFHTRAPTQREDGDMELALEQSLLKLMKGIPLQKIQLPEEGDRIYRHRFSTPDSQNMLRNAKEYLRAIRNGEALRQVEHVLGHQRLAQVHGIMSGQTRKSTREPISRYRTQLLANLSPEEIQARGGRRQASFKSYPEDDDILDNHGIMYHYNVSPAAWRETMSLEDFHRYYVNAALHPRMSNSGRGSADDFHRRIRMESPHWNPDDLSFGYAQHPAGMTDTQSGGGGFSESVAIPEDEDMKPGQNRGWVNRPWWPKTHHRDPENMPQGETEGYPPRSEQNFGYPSFESRRQEYDETHNPFDRSEMPPPDYGVPDVRYPRPNPIQQPKPKGAFESDPDIQRYFSIENTIQKEGDGGGEGGSFDGLNGTVFTSSHAGIFTPTFGERGTQRRHRKNKRKQEHKRKKLMGKDKKNGVERLVQFLREGSPVMHKAVNKVVNGQGQGHSAAGNREHNPKRINWEKRQEGISKIEDHPTMGMSNGSNLNKDTPMIHEAGRGGFEPQPEDPTAMTRSVQAKPDWNSNNYRVHKQKEDYEYTPGDEWITRPDERAEVPDIWGGTNTQEYHHELERPWEYEQDKFKDGQPVVDPETGEIQTESRFEPAPTSLSGGTHRPEENIEDYTRRGFTHEPEDSQTMYGQSIQNASTEATGIGPPTAQNTMAATGDHPQAAYTEKFDDKEKKQQVITQNDFENRVKQYDNKEDESGTVDQPRAAGAAASMTSYPDSSMQMMEKAWGSGPDTFDQDALHRGGDKDVSEDEEEIDEDKKDNNGWIPEDESKVKSEKEWLGKFEKLHKNSIEKGEINPILATLLALDND